MTRVHSNPAPAAAAAMLTTTSPTTACCDGEAKVLTIWRKSLLFNCRGFTVFDPKGNLVFQVDSYASGNKGEVVLKDAVGTPVLTVRRKKLSLRGHWLMYDGDEMINPLFSAKKLLNLLSSNCKEIARLAACRKGGNDNRDCGRWPCVVEGSYANRDCAMYDEKRCFIAEIQRKEAKAGVSLGDDVFRLVVHPGIDTAVAMAVVVALDQMFGS